MRQRVVFDAGGRIWLAGGNADADAVDYATVVAVVAHDGTEEKKALSAFPQFALRIEEIANASWIAAGVDTQYRYAFCDAPFCFFAAGSRHQ